MAVIDGSSIARARANECCKHLWTLRYYKLKGKAERIPHVMHIAITSSLACFRACWLLGRRLSSPQTLWLFCRIFLITSTSRDAVSESKRWCQMPPMKPDEVDEDEDYHQRYCSPPPWLEIVTPLGCAATVCMPCLLSKEHVGLMIIMTSIRTDLRSLRDAKPSMILRVPKLW